MNPTKPNPQPTSACAASEALPTAPCASSGALAETARPDEEWIDFNMLQTGTRIDRANYRYVRRDYERTGRQAKPVLDGECRYEYSHEYFWTRPPSGRRIGAHQVRKALYNAMLSGAAGHTYGCRCVWNFYRDGVQPIAPIEDGGDGDFVLVAEVCQ